MKCWCGKICEYGKYGDFYVCPEHGFEVLKPPEKKEIKKQKAK